MKRTILLFIGAVSWFAAVAHGIDGCGNTQLNAGLGQVGKVNFIGLNYGLVFNKFSNQNIWGQRITDRYVTHNFNFDGRYFLSKIFALRINTTYNHSLINSEGIILAQSGFGDSRITFEFPLINKCEGEQKKYFSVGAGLEMPTGKSSENIHLKAFSMGSGSWDFPISAQGIFGNNQKAFAFSAEYQINSFNQNHYKFGNQYSFSMSGIKTLDIKTFKMNVSLGSQFMHFGNDIYKDGVHYNAYSNKFSALMVNVMTQLNIGRSTIQIRYNRPAFLISNGTSKIDLHWLNIGLFRTFK